MPATLNPQIKDRIESFVTELDVLVRKSTLEALKGILAGDGAVPARRGPGRPSGSAKVEGAAESILSYVQANAGQGVGDIAAGAGVALKVAKRVILKLVASGQLKKTGRKRGTKYHIGSGRAPAAKRRGRKAKAA
jgi:hypothetical protein